jgi:hypothetical protein
MPLAITGKVRSAMNVSQETCLLCYEPCITGQPVDDGKIHGLNKAVDFNFSPAFQVPTI